MLNPRAMEVNFHLPGLVRAPPEFVIRTPDSDAPTSALAMLSFWPSTATLNVPLLTAAVSVTTAAEACEAEWEGLSKILTDR